MEKKNYADLPLSETGLPQELKLAIEVLEQIISDNLKHFPQQRQIKVESQQYNFMLNFSETFSESCSETLLLKKYFFSLTQIKE